MPLLLPMLFLANFCLPLQAKGSKAVITQMSMSSYLYQKKIGIFVPDFP